MLAHNDNALRGADERLDSGMKVGEAIERARLWWTALGASQIARSRFATDKDIPSGILHGLPWDRLTREEKLRIVKVWHHFHIRRPDVLEIDPAETFRLGVKGEEIG